MAAIDGPPPAYIIINRSWGEAEWILPIVSHLHGAGFTVVILFIHYHVYAEGGRTAAYLFDLMRKNSTRMLHPGGLLGGLSWSDRLYHSGAARRKAERDGRGPIGRTLHGLVPIVSPRSGNLRHFKIQRLAEFVCGKYMDFSLPKGLVFFDDTFAADAFAKREVYWKLVESLSSHTVFMYPHFTLPGTITPGLKQHQREYEVVFDRIELGRNKILLVSSADDATDLGRDDQLYVGNPKFQSWWAGALSADAPPLPESDRRGRRVLIVGKFRPKEEDLFYRLQRDMIEVFADLGWAVYFKPHPRTSSHVIRKWQASLGRAFGVRFTHEPITRLADRVDLVSSFPSGGIMDALAGGCPVVEYYDPEHLDIVPVMRGSRTDIATSVFEELGVVNTVRSCKELKSLVTSIAWDAAAFERFKRTQLNQFHLLFGQDLHGGEILVNKIHTLTAGA
jgi:hypothetical protein